MCFMERRILSTGKATPRTLSPVLGFSVHGDMDILERAQQGTMKMIKGLEHLSCE